ncbi:MAG: cytochrome b5-like heme/steroid binding domain-containing protein [Patescibacteria group bacterium]
MTQKPISIIIFLVVAGVIIFAVLGLRKAPSTAPISTQTQATTSAAGTSSSTPASIAVGEGLPVYTFADVAKHGSPKDCWTTVNGNVYDLTPFVGKHPGGEDILKVCGIDGTKLFTDQHGGQAKQENQLAGLEIGVLAK